LIYVGKSFIIHENTAHERKKSMKKIFALILTLALAAGIAAGCDMVEVDEEADGKRVVATVNGVDIVKSKYTEIYDYYYSYYTEQGYDFTTEDGLASLEEMKTGILDDLISQEVIRQLAEDEGYLEYTDEDRATATKEIADEKDESIASTITSLKSAMEDQELTDKKDGETDEEYYLRVATEQYEQNLADNDYTDEKLIEERLEYNALAKFQDDKLATVKALDADVIAKYDELVKAQTESYATKSAFVTAYNDASEIALCYYPEGYSLVQHILIPFSDDDQTTISELSTNVDDLQTELDDLNTDLEAATDTDAKAELQTSITAKQAEIDAANAELTAAETTAKAAIQEEADAVLASVQGVDEDGFIAVMLEKSTDTGMADEETAKKGYLVGEGDGMETSFSTAAQALEKTGDISGLVATSYGYHIIRKIKDLPSGKVAYADVKTAIYDSLTSDLKDTQWTTMTENWVAAAKVKKYTSRLD